MWIRRCDDSGASAHNQEYLKLVRRPLVHVLSLQVSHHISLLGPPALIRRCDDWLATLTHVPVAAVLVLNTPDDGRLRPKHVEWPCRNKTCIVLHQVGVSFDLYYDARKHKFKKLNNKSTTSNPCMSLQIRHEYHYASYNPVSLCTAHSTHTSMGKTDSF